MTNPYYIQSMSINWYYCKVQREIR